MFADVDNLSCNLSCTSDVSAECANEIVEYKVSFLISSHTDPM